LELVQESVLAEKRGEARQDINSIDEASLDGISDDDELKFAKEKNKMDDRHRQETLVPDDMTMPDIQNDMEGEKVHALDKEEQLELDRMFSAEKIPDGSLQQNRESDEDGQDGMDMLDIQSGMDDEEMHSQDKKEGVELDMMFSAEKNGDGSLQQNRDNDEDSQDSMDMLEIQNEMDDEKFSLDGKEEVESDMMFSAEKTADGSLQPNWGYDDYYDYYGPDDGMGYDEDFVGAP